MVGRRGLKRRLSFLSITSTRGICTPCIARNVACHVHIMEVAIADADGSITYLPYYLSVMYASQICVSGMQMVRLIDLLTLMQVAVVDAYVSIWFDYLPAISVCLYIICARFHVSVCMYASLLPFSSRAFPLVLLPTPSTICCRHLYSTPESPVDRPTCPAPCFAACPSGIPFLDLCAVVTPPHSPPPHVYQHHSRVLMCVSVLLTSPPAARSSARRGVKHRHLRMTINFNPVC